MRAVMPLLASIASLLVLWKAWAEGPDLGGLLLALGLAVVGVLLGWRAMLQQGTPAEDIPTRAAAADRLAGLAAVAAGGLSLILLAVLSLARIGRPA